LGRAGTNIKYPIAALCLLLVVAGFYLMFLYEVPDGQEVTNFWASSFLMIMGVVGCGFALVWKGKRDPLASRSE
jgi:hypothetical protein